MCYQMTLLSKFLTTHKGALDYVCFDVLSDYSFDWIPYYILHSYKVDHHNVYVDVL